MPTLRRAAPAALAAVAAISTGPALAREAMSAENMAYLLVQDPDSLGHYAGIDDECGIDEATLDRAVEDVLIRYRIRPLADAHSPEGLNLELYVSCASPDADGRQVYSIDAGFSLVQPDGADLLINHDYGAFGTGDADFILQAARESVEEALADFIAANRGSTAPRESSI